MKHSLQEMHQTMTRGACSSSSVAWIILLFTLNSNCLAQGVLDPNNQWIYEYNIYNTVIGLESQTIERITIGGDTTIDNLTYTKVLATKEPPCSVFDEVEYLRSDGNRIYRYFPPTQSEYTMLDFQVLLGYELLFESGGGPDGIDTAFAVLDSFGIEYAYDGTPLPVQYMRILNNQSFDDETVYKANDPIGFIQYGFLFPDIGTGLCDFLEGTRLRCFISGQDTIRFSEFDCFESSIPDATRDIQWSRVELFPNPVYTEINIPSELTVEGIVNIEGRRMGFMQEKQLVNVEHLMPGLYTIIVSKKEKEYFFGRILKL